MAAVDLKFRGAPLTQPARLVFGESEAAAEVGAQLDAALPALELQARLSHLQDARLDAALPALGLQAQASRLTDARLDATLPALGLVAAIERQGVDHAYLDATLPGVALDAQIGRVQDAHADITLDGPTLDAAAHFDSNVSRPVVGETSSDWQAGSRVVDGAQIRQQDAQGIQAGPASCWTAAARLVTGAQALKPKTLQALRAGVRPGHAEAVDLRQSTLTRFGDFARARAGLAARWQTGQGRRTQFHDAFQDRLRDRRPSASSAWQTGQGHRVGARHGHAQALPYRLARGGRYQEAMRPPPGWGWAPPIGPAADPCYLPSGLLVFADPAAVDGLLAFYCERHPPTPPAQTIVVPVREVYMVTNDLHLLRVSDNAEIPAISATLSLDYESWTWGFSATLPASALSMLGESGNPELELHINGAAFRVVCESMSRARQFGSATLQIQGRGRSAGLAAPYDATRTFGNAVDRTAQQLAGDVLTDNGVPMPWTVDWGITDWIVPAGAWSMQGSRMEALLAIAAAAGAYVQPHRTAQVVRVLPRFPVASWDWAGVTRDVDLPSAVVSVEGVAWSDKPVYNRVYLSGQRGGVLGKITRSGTAGDLLAPMATDALFTAAEAVRQRGTAILSDTGRLARVSLRMPVLSETGIIQPGKFVGYSDPIEATRVGLVRSVSVEAGFGQVWQTLGVDSYV